MERCAARGINEFLKERGRRSYTAKCPARERCGMGPNTIIALENTNDASAVMTYIATLCELSLRKKGGQEGTGK
jgi:hypothetical protein